MKKQVVQKLIKCALCTLAVFAVTFLTGSAFKLPQGAYIHIGDAVIYLFALIFPINIALPAAVIGAALADAAMGCYSYIIATVIIKAAAVMAVRLLVRLSDNVLTQDMLIGITGIITVAGYYAADVVISLISGESLIASISGSALDGAAPNILQALASALVYLALSGIVRGIIQKRKPSVQQTDETEV